ncbi:MAG: prepilin-type N-terminal cleavage/methylation domain-containing protein [Planctomycetota bacterium]
MHVRAGFTLIETLVTLALVVLLGSLVVPATLARSEQARTSAAERELELFPSIARREAQRLGGPVAIVLIPAEDERLELAAVRMPDSEEDPEADSNLPATWPRVAEDRVLPEGTSLVDPSELFDFVGEVDLVERRELVTAPKPEQESVPRVASPVDERGVPTGPVLVAWFLSDGTAVPVTTAAIELPDARRVRLTVRALSGEVGLSLALADPIEPDAADETKAGTAPAPTAAASAGGDEPG